MDNFETHDERRVMPWSCFSVEPGIYLPKFGVRSEINMFVGDHDARRDRRNPARNGPAVMPPQALAAVATLLAAVAARQPDRAATRPRQRRDHLDLPEHAFISGACSTARCIPAEEAAHEPVAVTTQELRGHATPALARDRSLASRSRA